MERKSFTRLIAVLLCFAMLLPNFTSLVTAVDISSDRVVSNGTKWVPVSNPFTTSEIPAYLTVNGTVSAEALEYDCGNGLTNDGAKSYMKLVTGTSQSEFTAYIKALLDAKFTQKYHKEFAADENGNKNVFYRFLSPKGDYVLIAYYLPAYNEARIIVDSAEDVVKSFAGGFYYESTTNESAQLMMAMYGLSMSPNGYDNTSKTAYNTGARNCGALIVIRMPDNSLFINDGGDIEQWSDEVCEGFMKFCRELTGKSEGEKVVINTWFISHAHTDHFDGIPRFFDMYHDQLELQNVMYNIDDERLGTTRDISGVMSMLQGYFPNVKYYKPHTGETFYIAGVKFDVLYTQEDRFVHNSENKMIIDIRDGDETNPNENRDGTYRSFLYESGDIVNFSDFNDTSTVLKLNFPAGITGAKEVSSILYGDVNLADQVILDIWPASTLQTDIMMVPHHGHDAHPELVALSDAKIFLYTQAKSAIFGPNGIVDKDVDLAGTYRPALVNHYLAMNGENGEDYFGTTDTRKTYWEGTETACILFGENVAFEDMPTGLTRDNEDPAGFTVYTMDAPFFKYEGWQNVTTARPSGEETSATGVAIDTSRIRFDLVKYTDGLTNDSRYLIVHDQTDNILVYNAIAGYVKQTDPNLGYSLYIGSGEEASNGLAQAYYKVNNNETTIKDKNSVYFARHLRDSALWITEQTDVSGTGTALTTSSGSARFSGKHYRYISMFKGLSTDDPYWYCISGNDYTGKDADGNPIGNQWRNLRPSKSPVFNKTASDDMRIELLSDNTCLIYYIDRANVDDDSTNEYVLRFLTVDNEGHWISKEYYSDTGYADAVSKAEADLSSLKLRLYQYTTRTGSMTVSYNGRTSYEVIKGTSQKNMVAVINQNFHVIDYSVRNQEIPCSGTSAKVGYYWLDMNAYDGTNDCTITVKYRNDNGSDSTITTITVDMQDYFHMSTVYNDDDTVNADTKFGSKYGFLYQGSKTVYEEVIYGTNLMDMTITVRHHETGITSSVVKVTSDMLIDPETGKAVDTAVLGEHTGLTLMYDGQVVGENFTLNVSENDASLINPPYPNEGSVIVNKQGITSEQDFSKTGVANIQLSASGIPVEKGVDLIVVMDLSGSMKNGLDTNVDAVDGQQRRVEAMEESLKSIVSELRSSGADVRIAMSDFGDLDHFTFEDSVAAKSIRDKAYYDISRNNDCGQAYEFYNHLNWVISGIDQEAGPYAMVQHKTNLGHSQYTGHVIPNIYTGSGVVNADAFVKVSSLDDNAMNGIVESLNANVDKAIGTNYDIGLEYAYRLGYAIRQENEVKGEERELVCIFMSDGAAIQYNYFSGNALSTGWSDLLMGVPDEITSVADYYANQGNWPEEIEQISKVLLTRLTTAFNDTNNIYDDDFSILLAPNYRWDNDFDVYENDITSDLYKYFIYSPDATRDNARYFYTYMDDQNYDIYSWDFLARIAEANNLESLTGVPFTQEYYRNNNVLPELVALLTQPLSENDIVYKTDAQGNPVYETDADGNIIYETDASGNLVPKKAIKCFRSKLINPDYRDLGRYDPTDTENQNVKEAQYKYYFLSNLTVDPNRSYTDQFFEAMESINVDCDWDLYALIAEVNRSHIKAELGLTNPRDAFRTLIAKMKTPVAGYGDYQTLSPYDYFYNADGKNWWAEAMKGDSDRLYPVINKYAFENNAVWGDDAYYGNVRNNYTTGTGLKLDGQDYISGFKGLDMEIYTVSFSICDDNKITSNVAENVLENIASGVNNFYAANTQAGLTDVLRTIVSELSIAATRAWYTDTMGKDYTLHMVADQTIKVLDYDLQRVEDAFGNVSYVRIGNPRVIETVTFEDLDDDGDLDAWSNRIYSTIIDANGKIDYVYKDIWDEETGLISAVRFFYNANTLDSVTISFGEQGSYPLAPETFFWIVGTIGKTESVLDYSVYLTGSLEGDRFLTGPDYYHDTNTNASMTYNNYMGIPNTLDTVSPKYPWGDSRVGVGYYLVDANGNIIADQTTGKITNDFSEAVCITRPVYEFLDWNDSNTVASAGVTAGEYLPDGYTLYNKDASYEVNIALNGSGSWDITDSKNSTYVSCDGANYNTDKSCGPDTYDTAHTIVWFAVVVDGPSTAPDVVVIDYGLPVDIDVLGNDLLFGAKGTLVALGDYTTDISYTGTVLDTNHYSANPYVGTYGTATIENGKIHYQLTGTEMNGTERINYAVYYTPGEGEGITYAGYYYNTVTIIPATSIYYEDDFLSYQTYVYNGSLYVPTNEDRWTEVQDANFDAVNGAHQDQDRPGSFILPEFDADNLYGTDSAYKDCYMYSLGSSKKFTASAAYAGSVSFDFYGTGFDVISLTNSDTGTIIVDVFELNQSNEQGKRVKSLIVDTYYGYVYNEDTDQWVVTPGADSLYQVPVIKAIDLQYGHYQAVITIAYAEFFDHKTSDDTYDFYMDAVRIYDPAQNDGSNDATIGGAYVEDAEYAPVYEELRNLLLTEREFYDSDAYLGDGYLHGAVFIDGIHNLHSGNYDAAFVKDPPEVGTYLNYGPNNEVYLAPGQAIAFQLNSPEALKSVHMAMKSTEGTAKIKIFRASAKMEHVNGFVVSTATDCYYDLTALAGDVVIIANVGSTAEDSTDGVLSVTNLKFTSDPDADETLSIEDIITVDGEAVRRALKALTYSADGNKPSGVDSPDTGDQAVPLMNCLFLLACLSMAAVLLLIYMGKKPARARNMR